MYVYDYLSTSQPPLNIMSRSAPAKAANYIISVYSWVNIVVIAFLKRFGGKLPAPLEKIGRLAQLTVAIATKRGFSKV